MHSSSQFAFIIFVVLVIGFGFLLVYLDKKENPAQMLKTDVVVSQEKFLEMINDKIKAQCHATYWEEKFNSLIKNIEGRVDKL